MKPQHIVKKNATKNIIYKGPNMITYISNTSDSFFASLSAKQALSRAFKCCNQYQSILRRNYLFQKFYLCRLHSK
ncbi:hypothetical protein Hanom_Chr13g01226351 [Helianthus anomalus]